jgi:hypothetical protein
VTIDNNDKFETRKPKKLKKKPITISKMCSCNTEYDVNKQHIQSEMRAITICHLSIPVIRLIELLKQRQRSAGHHVPLRASTKSCCWFAGREKVGFGWHKKFPSIARQIILALLRCYCQKVFPIRS